MLAGLISAAARGIKGGADAYSMVAKSEFEKGQKVDLSKQLLDMEEQMRLRVDEITRLRNIEDVGKNATANADAAPTVARGVVAGQVATEEAISDSGLPGKIAANKVAGVNADVTAGLPAAQAALTAEQLRAGEDNAAELARQKGAADATEFNAKVGSPEYLKSLTSEAAAKETPAARSQRALADFTLNNAKTLQDAKNRLAKATDQKERDALSRTISDLSGTSIESPAAKSQRELAEFTLNTAKILQNARTLLAKTTDQKERDALSRTISDLSGTSVKSVSDVASLAKSYLKIADAQRERANFASSQEEADALNEEAAFAEQQATALLNSISGGSGRVFPIPPPAAIEDLRRNPDTAAMFDKTFGPGAAARYKEAR